MAQTIIIGDIHGCHDELMELLDLAAPAVDDRIIAIGDIVDRGPDSERVLTFFRDTPNVISLMGNHERKHVRSARGQTRPALSQLIVRAQLGERYEAWLAFMDTFVRHIELPEATLVHGMLEPGVALDAQLDTVVIGTLTGEAYMQEKYPGPWYDHYTGPKPVVVGHHSYLGTGEPLIREGLVYAIDTGCCHGGRLTALILPEFRIVSVPSREDYWTRTRRDYAVMAGSGRSDLDLDWETLAAFAESADTEDLPEANQERARRCKEIAEKCGRLVEAVVEAVVRQGNEALADLRRAGDWTTCAPRTQAARYAQRVAGHPAAPLLFAARRGELNAEAVFHRAKTPRGLAQLAGQLGIDAELEEYPE
ncbi:MAG: metallophosphoesterase [Planctomycetota bacterium]